MGHHAIRPEQLPHAIKRLSKTIVRAIGTGARRGLTKGRTIVAKATPGIGALKAGWVVKRGSGDPVIGSIENHVWYAGLVESGSVPMHVAMGMRVDIRMWVERHIGKVQKGLRGEHRRAAVDNLTGQIITGIQTRGHKPQFFVHRVLDQVGDAIGDSIRTELEGVDDGVG